MANRTGIIAHRRIRLERLGLTRAEVEAWAQQLNGALEAGMEPAIVTETELVLDARLGRLVRI